MCPVFCLGVYLACIIGSIADLQKNKVHVWNCTYVSAGWVANTPLEVLEAACSPTQWLIYPCTYSADGTEEWQ